MIVYQQQIIDENIYERKLANSKDSARRAFPIYIKNRINTHWMHSIALDSWSHTWCALHKDFMNTYRTEEKNDCSPQEAKRAALSLTNLLTNLKPEKRTARFAIFQPIHSFTNTKGNQRKAWNFIHLFQFISELTPFQTLSHLTLRRVFPNRKFMYDWIGMYSHD